MKGISSIKISLFYPLLLALVLLGCSKANTLIRILGTWNVVNVTDVTSEVIEQWRFDVDDMLFIRHFMTYKPDSLFNEISGSYQVKVKMFKRYIDIYGFQGGWDFLNARWQIIKSDGKILMIVKDTQQATMIKEFVKR